MAEIQQGTMWHYAEAERLLQEAQKTYHNAQMGSERYNLARFLLEQAQVHATLAAAPIQPPRF